MAKKKTLHLVPQFHYDIEYLLPLEPYLEACFENLLEAHRLLVKHEDYTYLVEQAFLMEQFFREYPSLVDDFRRCAREGRFEMASGIYAMADQNMPSGESLVRQMVVGKKWCEETFGVSPSVFNAGDCTGACAQFPQIVTHCGYDRYVFMRAVDDCNRKSEVLWRGLDGTEVPAWWLAAGYGGWIPPIYTAIPPGIKSTRVPEDGINPACAHALSDDVLLPQGGDFVYPTEHAPANVEAWNAAHADRQIIFSTYSRALAKADWDKAVPYEGEWNPDRTGCYSSRIRIKQENRLCEALCRTAETVSLFANRRLGMAEERDGLLRAWKLTFVNQFHDCLWGTVCDDAHKRALNRAKRVRMVAQRIIERRLGAILDAQKGSPSGRRLLAFNPLPWPRTTDVHVPKHGMIAGIDRERTPEQAAGRKLRVVLPACGYEVIDVEAAPTEGASPFSVQTSDDGGLAIETPLYDVRVSPTGVIAKLTRKADGLEFSDPERPWLNVLCAQSDRGDLWQYYEGPVGDVEGVGFQRDLIDDPYPLETVLTRNGLRRLGWACDNRADMTDSIEVVENSADRFVVRVHGEIARYWPHFREFKESGLRLEYEQRITFYPDDARIDFHLVTDHHRGRWYRLRAAFFTPVREGRVVHEIPFGRWERPAGEFAAQNYIAGYDDERGLALFNRGQPGNNVTDGVMMLALMRSVNIDSRVDSDLAFEEGQRHVFDYAILPFGGEKELAPAALARRGAEFATPPYVYERSPDSLPVETGKELDASDELLSVKPESVVCTAVYQADEGVVVRLYESEGTAVEGTVTAGFTVTGAQETDAMLRNGKVVEVSGGSVSLSFRPFEIKTLLLRT